MLCQLSYVPVQPSRCVVGEAGPNGLGRNPTTSDVRFGGRLAPQVGLRLGGTAAAHDQQHNACHGQQQEDFLHEVASLDGT